MLGEAAGIDRAVSPLPLGSKRRAERNTAKEAACTKPGIGTTSECVRDEVGKDEFPPNNRAHPPRLFPNTQLLSCSQ